MKNKNSILNIFKRSNMTAIGMVLIIMFVIACIGSPYFLDVYNIQSLLRDLAIIGMIGIAQSLLLLVGELDLSVGKIATLCGILSGMLMIYAKINPWLALICGLIFGIFFGLLNGLIITKMRLNSMVATIVLFEDLGLPPVKKTKTGRYIYAIGNSREAATILGIKVDQIRVFIYVVVGLISSLAGLLYVCRLGSAQSTLGESWPMNSIAASVIGGVSLNGGIGNPAGALIGAAIISIISNMIVLFGVNAYWQQAVSGIVVVLAISFSSIMEIIRERRARS